MKCLTGQMALIDQSRDGEGAVKGDKALCPVRNDPSEDRFAPPGSDGFEAFTAAYPASKRSVHLPRAEKAWKALGVDDRERVMRFLAVAVRSQRWDDPRFLPDMSSVINDTANRYWRGPIENWIDPTVCPECFQLWRVHLPFPRPDDGSRCPR